MRINVPGIYGYVDRGGAWFRFGPRSSSPQRPGFGIRNHRVYPPLFTERYNRTDHRYYHLGPWCFTFLDKS